MGLAEHLALRARWRARLETMPCERQPAAFADRRIRRSGISSEPSLYTRPDGTWSMTPALPARAAPCRRPWPPAPRARRATRASFACSCMCSASPWTGIGDLRPQPVIELLELAAAGMAGDVHDVRAVGDDLDALADQELMMRPTGFSLPGIVRDEKITRRLATARCRDARPAPRGPARRAARPGCP